MEEKRKHTLVRLEARGAIPLLTYPRPAIPGGKRVGDWMLEDNWEVEDPLFRAALNLQPR